jgi:hypothetical protein
MPGLDCYAAAFPNPMADTFASPKHLVEGPSAKCFREAKVSAIGFEKAAA